jgi:hypothetical protein
MVRTSRRYFTPIITHQERGREGSKGFAVSDEFRERGGWPRLADRGITSAISGMKSNNSGSKQRFPSDDS